MARKGRARRFREARELKQGFDDGLFEEGSRTLADAEEKSDEEPEDTDAAEEDWDDEADEGYDWDPDRQVDQG